MIPFMLALDICTSKNRTLTNTNQQCIQYNIYSNENISTVKNIYKFTNFIGLKLSLFNLIRSGIVIGAIFFLLKKIIQKRNELWNII